MYNHFTAHNPQAQNQLLNRHRDGNFKLDDVDESTASKQNPQKKQNKQTNKNNHRLCVYLLRRSLFKITFMEFLVFRSSTIKAISLSRSWSRTNMKCCVLVFILCTYITICKSCDSFHFCIWEGECPVYLQRKAPGNMSKSLYACSRWCFENTTCILLSWDPGSCWQVGFSGFVGVTERVYKIRNDQIERHWDYGL